MLAAAFCFVFFSYVVLAREDAPCARESAYFFDDSKTGNPNTIAGGLSLIVCTVAAFAGAYGSGRGCYTYETGSCAGVGFWSTSGNPTGAPGGSRARTLATLRARGRDGTTHAAASEASN